MESVAALKEEIENEKKSSSKKAITKQATARKSKKAEVKEEEGDLYSAPVGQEAF